MLNWDLQRACFDYRRNDDVKATRAYDLSDFVMVGDGYKCFSSLPQDLACDGIDKYVEPGLNPPAKERHPTLQYHTTMRSAQLTQ